MEKETSTETWHFGRRIFSTLVVNCWDAVQNRQHGSNCRLRYKLTNPRNIVSTDSCVPRISFEAINLTKFYPVVAYDISRKNVVIHVSRLQPHTEIYKIGSPVVKSNFGNFGVINSFVPLGHPILTAVSPNPQGKKK